MNMKNPSESFTMMTEMIMPNDTNPLGNLMGGNLMRWMDICGGICAGKHSEAHVVTASVDHVSFEKPINLGDVIEITSKVTRAFKTSLEVYIEVHVLKITGAEKLKSNHAYMTFVALDSKTYVPIQIPKLNPVTDEEKLIYESAPRRRELRLILSGRIKPEQATGLRKFFDEMDKL